MDTTDTKRRLLERRERLAQRLERIRGDRRRRADPLTPDFSDQAIQRENDETLDVLDQRVRAELAEIDGALARLADASYGRCAACGAPISPERLEVLPATRTCAACATDAPAALE